MHTIACVKCGLSFGVPEQLQQAMCPQCGTKMAIAAPESKHIRRPPGSRSKTGSSVDLQRPAGKPESRIMRKDVGSESKRLARRPDSKQITMSDSRRLKRYAEEQAAAKRRGETSLLWAGIIMLLVALPMFLFARSQKVKAKEGRIQGLQSDLQSAQDGLAQLNENIRTREQTLSGKKREISKIQLELKQVKTDSAKAEAAYAKEIAALEAERDELQEKARVEQNPDPAGNVVESGSRVDRIQASMKRVVVIRTDIASGSGFLVNAGGGIITNYHVIEGSSKITVALQHSDSTKTETLESATVVAVDPEKDLAYLQVGSAPAAVGADGKYPVVEIRMDPPLKAGEKVYAIGSPGLGAELLEYTVTQGIVSNPRRSSETRDLVQTTAAVNSGNSGGPLFDDNGKVIGVITLKGVNVESVAFAVATSTLQTFLAALTDPRYAITGTLEEWEIKNRPMSRLSNGVFSLNEAPSFQVPSDIDDMILSKDGKTLYCLSSATGQIQQYHIDTMKAGKTFYCDAIVTSMDLEMPSGAFLYVVKGETGKVLQIRTSTMELVNEILVNPPPTRVEYFGGIKSEIAMYNPSRGTPIQICKKTEFDEKDPLYISLNNEMYVCAAGANEKWACWVHAGIQDVFSVVVVPASSFMSNVEKVVKYQDEARKKGVTRALIDRVNAALKEMDEKRMSYTISSVILAQEGTASDQMLFAGKDRLIFARRSFKIGKSVELEGLFEPSSLSRNPPPELREKLDDIRFLDNIFTVSEDGKWAASGLEIYDVETRKAVKRLPFPSAIHRFSDDGKSLYVYNGFQSVIHIVENWQDVLPDPY